MSYEAANEQLLIAAASESSNGFHGGMFELNAEFDADSLLYFLSHFECDGHTVHTLTQWCLPPPLTSTVKLSLFTPVHCSPLSLAARLRDVALTVLLILTIAGLFLIDLIYVHV